MLTEKQRIDAIGSCERIQELCAQQQVAFQNILRIFDNLAKGRDPKDGIEALSPVAHGNSAEQVEVVKP